MTKREANLLVRDINEVADLRRPDLFVLRRQKHGSHTHLEILTKLVSDEPRANEPRQLVTYQLQSVAPHRLLRFSQKAVNVVDCDVKRLGNQFEFQMNVHEPTSVSET